MILRLKIGTQRFFWFPTCRRSSKTTVSTTEGAYVYVVVFVEWIHMHVVVYYHHSVQDDDDVVSNRVHSCLFLFFVVVHFDERWAKQSFDQPVRTICEVTTLSDCCQGQ